MQQLYFTFYWWWTWFRQLPGSFLQPLSTHVMGMTTTWQGLVHSKKCLRQRGSGKNFAFMIKSWITVNSAFQSILSVPLSCFDEEN